ncbi:MAG: TetR/AcrR family transcriptional regulator [Geobacteraceae bacterium]|nr:TetR/AcrR family transcriptional regulator [Geobacteraceae bacterium]NTW79238.1 TetR/AcrR family transcriptional regulator [Geobacteraceae bacterium]
MRPPSKNLPADERKAVTVQTVVKLAAEQNPNDITTSAIASAMGLTQGALFRHFVSKDAIWQTVMEWVADCLLTRVDNATDAAPSPLAALEAIFMTHIDFVTQHPGVPRMLLAELQRAGMTPAKKMVQTLLKRYEERICSLIEQGKSCGELEPTVATASAATLFIGTIQGLVIRSLLTENPKKTQSDAAAVFAVYHRGVRSTQ